MKTLELFFNTKSQPETIYETWCFEPDPREKELGKLYLIAELEGRDSTSLNYLVSSISESYSHRGTLEGVIKPTKQKIQERGLNKLELALLELKEGKLTFTKTEGIKIALLRGREVANVGSKLKGNLSSLGTTELEPKDKIMAVTGEVWRTLRQKHLISKITPYSKNQSIENTLVENTETPGAALLVSFSSNPFQKVKEFFRRTLRPTKTNLPHSDLLSRRINLIRPSEQRPTKLPFLIAWSYLLSFLFIRMLVTLVGSADSEIARTVKEGSTVINFHLGRNIILFGYHIHHFYFGILLIAIAGWLAITNSSRLTKEKLAVIYGIGLGLLMDEIGLLLTWGNYASSLSYLLGVLLLGILLNILYFPSFWHKVRSKVTEASFAWPLLNKSLKTIVRVADKISGRSKQ